MHLPLHRLALLAFLLYALPAFGQAGPQGLFFPGTASGVTAPSGLFNNLSVGPGSVSIIGGSNNGSDQLSNVGVNGVWPVTAWGARGDAQYLTDGSMTSGSATLTSAAQANFSAADVGKYIEVHGAGAGGFPLQSQILSVTDTKHVVLINNASATVTNVAFGYGTDNTTAVQNAEISCERNFPRTIFWPPGAYIIGAVQFGDPATKAAVGQTAQAPGCWANSGAERERSQIWCKAGTPVCVQRQNTADTTVEKLQLTSVMHNAVPIDMAWTLLDYSYAGGSPSAFNVFRDLCAKNFAGVGIQIDRGGNDAVISGLITAAQLSTATSPAQVVGSISGTTLTVTAVNWGHVFLGALISGTGIAANTHVVSFATGTGNAGTYNLDVSQTVASGAINVGAPGAAAAAVSLLAEGGPVNADNVIASGGVILVDAQSWSITHSGIYGGLEIFGSDFNAGSLDGNQFLNGDLNHNGDQIYSTIGCNPNGTASLHITGTLFDGNPVFGGHFWTGADVRSSWFGATGPMFDTIDTSCGPANGYRPQFNFDHDEFANFTVNLPANIRWKIDNSSAGNLVLGSLGTLSGEIIHQEVIYGGSVTWPVCSALNQGTPICVNDAGGCVAGTVYGPAGGSTHCHLHCTGAGAQWKADGFSCDN